MPSNDKDSEKGFKIAKLANGTIQNKKMYELMKKPWFVAIMQRLKNR